MPDNKRELRTEFTADSSDLTNESKKASRALEDVADATKDVGRQSEISDRDIDAMGDALAEAARESDKSQEALKRMRDEIRKLKGETPSIDAVGDKFHDLSDDARAAGSEVGDEFKQNLGQTLASGGNPLDLITESLAGLTAGFGAAGAGIAAGFLLVFGKIKAQIEEFNAAVTEQTESMWTTALETIAGKVGQVGLEITNAKLAQAELDRLWTEAPDEMTKLVQAAKDLGINAWDVVAARAGDEKAIKKVKAAMDDVYERQNAGLDITVETLQGVQTVETALIEAETAQKKWNAQASAYNDSLAPGASRLSQMKEDLAWVASQPPIKVDVEAAMIKQYGTTTPYGTGGGYTTRGKAAPGAQAAGGPPAPPPVVTNNWSVRIEGARDPDATVRAVQRWARDNGRPDSVRVRAR